MEGNGPGNVVRVMIVTSVDPLKIVTSLSTSAEQVHEEEVIGEFVKMWFWPSLGASTRNP